MDNSISRWAVIYTRVSDVRQQVRGDGLRSQETRCREYAGYRNYDIVNVFSDKISGSTSKRPGFDAMLEFLRKNRTRAPVVIIDDINRFARNIVSHWSLRETITAAGGQLESPSVVFGEDSDSILVENMLASVAQHQRQKNAEQTKNRMRARMLNGYWVFPAPIGYEYRQTRGQGKVLKRKEPEASILQEALEGFACGRFRSQSEVKNFLESRPDFPKSNKNGELKQQRVIEYLNKSLYAGLIEHADWNVSQRKGQHEGLISIKTYNQIQDCLKTKVYAPARKNIGEDFPLRGAVLCAGCGEPLRAGWSKGRAKMYPYYLCQTKTCDSYGKSIPRQAIEDRFEQLLKTATPTEALLSLARDFFKDLWDKQVIQDQAIAENLKAERAAVEKKINSMLDRIIDASSKSVIAAFEARISELEREKLAFDEQLQKTTPKRDTFEDLLEPAIAFLSNPLQLWRSDRFEDKRMVLRLTFSSHLAYCRHGGFRTPNLSLPFKVLGDISDPEKAMVHLRGESSNTLIDTLVGWEQQLSGLLPKIRVEDQSKKSA